MRVGHNVAVAYRKSAAGDDAAAAHARDFDDDVRGLLDTGLVDRGGDGQGARQAARLETGEDRRELHPGQDLGDARKKRGRTWRDRVQTAEKNRALDLLRDLWARASREAEAEEPAHDQHRKCGQCGSGDRVGRRVDSSAQDVAPDRLADGEADARAETSSDHEHKHRAQRTRAGVVDLQVIEDKPGGRGAEKNADQQAEVLGQREPEAAPVSVREPDEGGDENEDVDEVDHGLYLVTPYRGDVAPR